MRDSDWTEKVMLGKDGLSVAQLAQNLQLRPT
jgi:hypothetical protein